ncbi:MAG: ABC transporter permease [Nitrospinaceae bacterium]|jgi:peptide/nickel transport system permease protein|nr:ABC transporter permease [Nitrospinaceae bacterium]MBT3432979.1 ABC transporter permease [Nitrospinaceae bacterium]MBT3819764.1 ABC transporter permease [Nitrospinaceae bacterium]MBT5368296.1 ABC transporter permease [Nitrospinaceae bacterium]MBT5946551.1 ABC transporter permease [Nitrospinaceae bacterium]
MTTWTETPQADEFAEEILTPWQRIARSLRQDRLAMGGATVLIFFLALAVVGWWGTSGDDPYFSPSTVRLPDRFRPPMAKPNLDAVAPEEAPPLGIYVFGTDELGRDVFARMLEGTKIAMAVGFVAVGISMLLGVFMGGIAGFHGNRQIGPASLLGAILFPITGGFLFSGISWWYLFPLEGALVFIGIILGMWLESLPTFGFLKRHPIVNVDTIFIVLVDVQLSFPTFFLILTAIAVLPPSIWNVMVVIGITSWVGPARFVRAEILSLRERPYIEAARAIGAKDKRLIFLHLVPNSLAAVLVSATIGVPAAILTEAGLSFLGFGVPLPDASWGNILSDGRKFLFDAPWLMFIPGFAILIVVLAFNLFGEGLRDALNPRSRPK